jgi:hypothetical protein
MPPVGAAIGAIAASATAAGVGTFVTSIVGRMLVSVAASALIQALSGTSAAARQGGGISTSVTLTGSTNPASFIMGRYATGGVMVCPPMSHGEAGKTPNAYLTYVIGLSCVAGCSLVQLILDGEIVTLGGAAHADYGTPMQGRYDGYGWVKFYDGSQTVADPGLLAKYGSYPKRPWSSDMIGRGLCYAIVTMRYNPELWQGFPAWRFVLDGIPLYDPRKDSTAGGSGAHRWATPSTWEQTNNAFNLIHQVMRGITLPWGNVWGGGFAASRLPYASWAAAMNECARAVDNASGGTEAQFRAGFEVKVNRPPADIIGEFLKASSGRLAEIGGTWKARAGATGLPVYFLSDADAVITQPEDYRPFPALAQTYNGVSATYPEPASRWESKPAPPRYNATWEAEDGGRRLVADLALPAVPYADQVQRLTKALAADNRRWRRHVRPLPPDAFVVEPLDTVSWTSTINGYTDKVFEVSAQTDDLLTVIQKLGLREVDPDDYSYPGTIWLPSGASAPGTNIPAAQAVPGYDFLAVSVVDSTGTGRRPAVRHVWDPDGLDDVTGVQWETRVVGAGNLINRGSTQNVSAGAVTITSGILPKTGYEGRTKLVAPGRQTNWTAWTLCDPSQTPALYTNTDDIAGGAITKKGQSSSSTKWKLTSKTVWTRVRSITIDRPIGHRVEFTIGFKMSGGGDCVAIARLLRGSTVVEGETPYSVVAGVGDTKCYLPEDGDTTGGKVTYHVEFRRGDFAGKTNYAQINGIKVRYRVVQR